MKRPGIITTFCVIGYLSIMFTFPQVFSPGIKKLGVFMPAGYGVLVAANFIAYVGIWYFKQWGVQLFLLSFFAKILFYISISQFGFFFYVNTFISVVFIVVLLRFYTRMNPNL
jgi:hypothetical protein